MSGLNAGQIAALESLTGRLISVAKAEGITFAIYEGGLWCGECDAADADDDCCVLPERIRNALISAREGLAP